jgi:hypothetical protein
MWKVEAPAFHRKITISATDSSGKQLSVMAEGFKVASIGDPPRVINNGLHNAGSLTTSFPGEHIRCGIYWDCLCSNVSKPFAYYAAKAERFLFNRGTACLVLVSFKLSSTFRPIGTQG